MDLAAVAQSLRSEKYKSLKNNSYVYRSRPALVTVGLIAATAGWYTAKHFALHASLTFPVISNAIALGLAGVFALVGVSHLISANLLHGRYRPRQFSPGFTRVAGVAELLAALFLAVPQIRVWGSVLAAIILFVTVASLLSRGKYLYAIPPVLMMIALVPAIAVTN